MFVYPLYLFLLKTKFLYMYIFLNWYVLLILTFIQIITLITEYAKMQV